MTQMNKEYRKLVIKILNDGIKQEGRNGTQFIIPHYSFVVDDMENDHTLCFRKMYYKGVNGEFKTLIDEYSPLVNVSQFEAKGCHYWNKWAGEDGALNLDYYNKLHPQLKDIINQIKEDPYSRRHVVDLWDHDNAKSGELSLHCCWYSFVFSVIDDILHMHWIQRSVDTMLGLPSDIYLAYLFMDTVSKAAGYKIGSCRFSLSNVHIYAEHVEGAFELIRRTCKDHNKPIKFELKE